MATGTPMIVKLVPCGQRDHAQGRPMVSACSPAVTSVSPTDTLQRA